MHLMMTTYIWSTIPFISFRSITSFFSFHTFFSLNGYVETNICYRLVHTTCPGTPFLPGGPSSPGGPLSKLTISILITLRLYHISLFTFRSICSIDSWWPWRSYRSFHTLSQVKFFMYCSTVLEYLLEDLVFPLNHDHPK